MNLEKISSARLNALSTAASAIMPSLINSAQAAPKLPSPCLAWRREARVGRIWCITGHASRGRVTIGVRRCRCGASVAQSRKH